MSSDLSRSQSDLDTEAAAKRRSAETTSKPEPTAASIDAALLRGVSANVGQTAAALGHTDSAARARVVTSMQRSHGNASVQRVLQRSASDSAAATSDDLAERIQAASGGGSALDANVQRRLEQGLGADLSGVRVHTDAEADRLSRSVSASAFTTGSDIFFREGTYDPGSSDGMRTLAHEASHVVQQASGPVSGTPAPGGVSISDPSDSYEQAADRHATSVTSASPSPSGPSVQREDALPEEEPKNPEEEEPQAG